MTTSRPAAEGLAPGHFPGPPVAAGHVAPCPRRLRARDAAGWALDTTRAFYVWEHPYYPQYAVPRADLADRLAASARPAPPDDRLRDHVVVTLDETVAWFEESERIHGHPRNPYVRVDALRADRTVTVRLPGSREVLARSSSPVAVFETGLPPRWYLDPTVVAWSLLTPSDTVTRCPYKGVTTAWWSTADLADVAWTYGAPTAALGAIAGLVAFDDTRVVVEVDP
ncbi:DUF427 domain-containing protein [Actinomycetospora soli]|uniref:DUF427 domain-containing protein n=1 Tax=Actinomycetospora soli TaxID=2893887 RepID=UPI001E2CDB19|nr:DUF427 domain-containing protein [Actinomycetospora soli]MCD2188307.1 DUF427 domain-containing protein [Actinomycetospora soli]